METIRQNRHRLGCSCLKMLQREILQLLYKYPQRKKLGIIKLYIEKDKQSRNSLHIFKYNGLSLSYVCSCNRETVEDVYIDTIHKSCSLPADVTGFILSCSTGSILN